MADRPVRRDVLAGDGTWVENRPSKWQQIRNILSPYVTAPINAMERLVNSPAIQYGFAPTEQDVADSFALAGLVTGGSAFALKPRNAMTMGIRAYHGSPHSFDKFSTSKIGTGEGAQAYGHGLYFAENEDIARAYRDALAPAPSAAQEAAQRAITQYGDASTAADEIAKVINAGGLLPETINHYKAVEAILRSEASASPGSMYEVNIAADPEAFLDWDKPLSKQPEAVRDILQGHTPLQKNRPYQQTDLGKDIYYKNTQGLGGGDIAAEELKRLGIPGVKYLDASSRGVGEGTRNYVVFDDRLISIVRKYGIAGASAMLGYNILDNISEAQAEELRRIEKGMELRK